MKSGGTTIWEIYFPLRGSRGHGPVYIASFPQILYFWPTLIVVLGAALSQRISESESSTAGWSFLGALVLNFIVLAHDFDQKQFLIFVLVLVVLGMLMWISALYGFTFVQTAAGRVFALQPIISTDAYLVFGSALTLLMVWGIISPLFSYWKFEQNEFVHYSQPVG